LKILINRRFREGFFEGATKASFVPNQKFYSYIYSLRKYFLRWDLEFAYVAYL